MRNRQSGLTLTELLIIVAVIGCLAVALFSANGCSGCRVDQDTAVQAVEKQGYRVISVDDEHPWAPGRAGCGEDDNIAYDMTVENARGQVVDIVACCGTYKNCTVRTR